MTLKNFLAELSFVKIDGIKRHAKGLLMELEKSNRKEVLDYEIIPEMKVWKEYHGKTFWNKNDLKE